MNVALYHVYDNFYRLVTVVLLITLELDSNNFSSRIHFLVTLYSVDNSLSLHFFSGLQQLVVNIYLGLALGALSNSILHTNVVAV